MLTAKEATIALRKRIAEYEIPASVLANVEKGILESIEHGINDYRVNTDDLNGESIYLVLPGIRKIMKSKGYGTNGWGIHWDE